MKQNTIEQKLLPVWIGITAFILSGFAGLVYESIWARYLKLILGSAAFAQALVLTIFLGGLASGAAIASRYSHKIKSPLIVYAAIEAILALWAMQFHDIFVFTRDTLESGVQNFNVVRWPIAVLLLLPQSLLLGATFPLLTSVFTRVKTKSAGSAVALMYFANSWGGMLGVLAVAYVLVHALGLPGSLLIGGLCSALAGLIAWVSHHRYFVPDLVAQPARSKNVPAKIFLMIAFGTGLASLVYEIIWIRMLALVLGSSTRAFELMLAAFIFGLAVGGLAIRNYVDRKDKMQLLALIQLAAAVLVIATAFSYEQLFYLSHYVRLNLPLDENGYNLYGLFNFVAALLLMFGPTFCAGMSLPLLTKVVMEHSGEKALGSVYAWNSVGAVVGIWLAVHLLLPNFGLMMSLVVGATISSVIAIALLKMNQSPSLKRAGICIAMLVIVIVIQPTYNKTLIISGPFRGSSKTALNTDETITSYLRHGKTATISVQDFGDYSSIATNGKSDSNVPHSLEVGAGGDYMTTTMLGSLPFLYHPYARKVAVVGLGTGTTTATMLESEHVEEITTVEIESSVIEAAKFFPLSATIYQDPRSTISQIDAKAFFAETKNNEFDIIVAEPSNPWVSGVASLFTVEHLEQMKRSLADDGILVQWFHLYESNAESFSSIFKAFNQVFPNYVLFSSQAGDIILLTSNDPKRIEKLVPDAFKINSTLKKRLSVADINTIDDVAALGIANKKLIKPLLDSINVPANSDYFPVLDEYAARGFYLRSSFEFGDVVTIYGRLFNDYIFSEQQFRKAFVPVSNSASSFRQDNVAEALKVFNPANSLQESFINYANYYKRDDLQIASIFDSNCGDDRQMFLRTSYLARTLNVYDSSLLEIERLRLWELIKENIPCLENWKGSQKAGPIINLYEAYMTNDYLTTSKIGRELIPGENRVGESTEIGILIKIMISEYALGNYEEVVAQGFRLAPGTAIQDVLAVRLLVGHALGKIQ